MIGLATNHVLMLKNFLFIKSSEARQLAQIMQTYMLTTKIDRDQSDRSDQAV